MRMDIEFNDEQASQLSALAQRLGVEPSELVRKVCLELLARPRDDALRTAERVLEKNQELYRRLA